MNKFKKFLSFLLIAVLCVWLPQSYATTTDSIAYGTSTAVTITLNSLAASATVCRQSTVVDNTSNKFVDAIGTVIISNSASTIGSSKSVYVYVFGSEDGTNYDQDDGVMGASDAGYTINTSTNLRGPVVISSPTTSKVYNKVIPSVASFFGGVMPRKWGIVVCNDTNQTLAGSGNSVSYTGINYTNA